MLLLRTSLTPAGLTLHAHSRRTITSDALRALDTWIESVRGKQRTVEDIVAPRHLLHLGATIATSQHAEFPVWPSDVRLGAHFRPGHQLVFFNAANPEGALRADGSDADFTPPAPFTRRMWAGGRMEWQAGANEAVGDEVEAVAEVVEVKKRIDSATPMLFVKQRISAYSIFTSDFEVVEERTHVFQPPGTAPRSPRAVDNLPAHVEFSLSYLPTPTTLFRFSALTFNAHSIHLDREYARKEGYEERLVHGPLNALMMLETLCFYHPEAATTIRSFEYRAVNPMVVNKVITINGAWVGSKDSGPNRTAKLWVVNEDGYVGMTGTVELAPKPFQ